MSNVDVYSTLVKYVEYVYSQEGTTFVGDFWWRYTKVFSAEERKLLEDISNGIPETSGKVVSTNE